MNVFGYVRRHVRALLFIVAMLSISGVALMLHMPVSLFPDVTFPRIVILADNGEEPAERMMVEVTRPLESLISAVPGVRVVKSITSRGSTEISIGLAWGSNVSDILQLLQGRIADDRTLLPPTATIRTEQMTVAVFPIHGFSLTSDTLDQVALRDIALYQIRPALLRIEGMARVEVEGGDTREFRVTVSPERLAADHLSMHDVSDAIRKTNIIASPGLAATDYQLYLSIVTGQLHSIEDIQNVVVTVRDGVPIRIADIGDVTPSVADKFIRTTARGRDAVLINILKQPTASTVEISQAAEDAIKELKLPAGVHLENFYDQGSFISQAILTTRDSILIGIGLAMLVIFVFLRNWRVTLVIMVTVPATLAATFALLYASGLTINIMTLGGIAAAVGLIIDDAIVVIENAFAEFERSRSEGKTFAETVGHSLHGLMPAILGSTASTIVIHVPLAFLGGITGAFFASLSVTMVFAMTISFLFSISLVPLLVLMMRPGARLSATIGREGREPKFNSRYARLMRRLIRVRWLAIPFAGVVVVLTWWLFTQLGSGFMPEMDEGTFVLDYSSPPGTSLDETNRVLGHVETFLMSIPEVESYSRRTGTQLGFFLTEPNRGDYLIKLRKNRKRAIEDVITEVRHHVESTEPTLRIEFGQLMMDVIGDLTNEPSPVVIKIFGGDPEQMHAAAKQIKSLIETVPGVVDAFDGIVISGPSLVIQVDPLKAARAGLTVEDVRDELSTMMRGSAETSIQRGEKLLNIRVRFPDVFRSAPENLDNVRLVNSTGALIPLQNIAAISRTPGQAEVRREGLRQLVAVTARIEDRDLGSTIKDVKKILKSKLALPAGMTYEFGGVYQTQQESFYGLMLVAMAGALLVFVVLLIEFREFAVPFSILIVNALSLVGVFGALWITHVTLNISSLVGMIMIIGIVAENAIFIMHSAQRFQREGLQPGDALIEACGVRTRPILMTMLAAVLALLPLSLGIGAGAQLQQPLAIAVIGGFTVSSILLLFVLPMIYSMLAGHRIIHWRMKKVE